MAEIRNGGCRAAADAGRTIGRRLSGSAISLACVSAAACAALVLYPLPSPGPALSWQSSVALAQEPDGMIGANDPMVIFEKGNRAMRLGDNEAAIMAFSTIRKNHPDSEVAMQAAYYLGKCYLSDGREREALEVWDAYRRKSRFIGNRHELFGLYVKFGMDAKVLAELSDKLAKNPGDMNTRMEYIDLLIYLNKVDDAIRQYDALIAMSPNSNYFYYKNAGDLLVRFRRFKEALAYYERLLQFDINNETYLEALGNCHYQLGDGAAARKHWSRIIEGSRDWARFNYLANVYQAHGMYDDAVAVYSECQRRSENPTLYFEQLAELYEIAGRFENLMKLYAMVSRRSPSALAIIEGRLAETIKRNDEAGGPLAKIAAAAMAAPGRKNSEFLKMARVIFMALKKPAEALAAASELSANMNDPSHLYELSAGLRAMGETDLALAALAKISEMFPATPAAYLASYRAAGYIEEAGRYAEALAAYDRVRNDQNYSNLQPDALLRIGRLQYEKLGAPEKALAIFRQLEQSPVKKDQGIYYSSIYAMHHGDFKKAAEGFSALTEPRREISQEAEMMAGYLDVYSGTVEAGINKLCDIVRLNPAAEGAAEMFTFALALRRSAGAPDIRAEYIAADRWYRAGAADSAEAALARFFAAASKRPTGEVGIEPDARLLGARIERMRKRPEKFRESIKKLVADHPGSHIAPIALYELASDLAAAKDRAGAAAAYETILKRYPSCLLTKKAREGLKRINGGNDGTKKRSSFFGYN